MHIERRCGTCDGTDPGPNDLEDKETFRSGPARRRVYIRLVSETSPLARVLDRTDPLPLWAQLLGDLQTRLQAGEFDEAFPTDTQLMADYGVSRPTVREAIRSLTQRGVLVRERGQLAVVASSGSPHYASTAQRLLASASAPGRTRHTEVLSARPAQDGEVAVELGVDPDTKFQHITQVHFADGHPIAHDSIWLVDTTDTASGLKRSKSTDVEAVLRQALAHVDATNETITAESLDPVLADSLELGDVRDMPVVIVVRWVALHRDRAVALRVTRIPSARFSMSATWRADRARTVVLDAEPITGHTLTDLAGAAIRAHRHWRSHLAAAIAAGDDIDVAAVGSDVECELGRWLMDPPSPIARAADLGSARSHHTNFHRAAAEAVQVAREGDIERSIRMLMKGSVSRHSNALTAALKLLAEPLSAAPSSAASAGTKRTAARKAADKAAGPANHTSRLTTSRKR